MVNNRSLVSLEHHQECKIVNRFLKMPFFYEAVGNLSDLVSGLSFNFSLPRVT